MKIILLWGFWKWWLKGVNLSICRALWFYGLHVLVCQYQILIVPLSPQIDYYIIQFHFHLISQLFVDPVKWMILYLGFAEKDIQWELYKLYTKEVYVCVCACVGVWKSILCRRRASSKLASLIKSTGGFVFARVSGTETFYRIVLLCRTFTSIIYQRRVQ